ncbi:LacI family DNA-binding transcriptional regulator [Paraglaciecola chathamensis]|uniref:HTH lacI-type domain-containing protein n=1 Tax=Paraglaciecola agarilytica NO2 TaxID=1125747 RepID=A0ABQ0IDD4_9ALTE|nr:LacI family DNA-binding transcriptional regulator [Paraglaciecola agarilytica]GAC07293.1 hypothetical protein GAGA_4468 [Paraglaciecola agarilytica NO2]
MSNGKMTSVKLAKLAGVSHATVSRVFNNSTKVTEKTRDKILQLASEYGYRPNAIATSLNRSQSGLVAIIVNDTSDLWECEQLSLLTNDLLNVGLMPLVLNCSQQNDKLSIMNMASSYQVDFTIIFSEIVAFEEVCNIFKYSKTIVIANEEQAHHGHASIIMDPSSAIREAIDFMVASGRRHFFYLSGRITSWIDKQRRASYVDNLNRHGLKLIGEAQGNYKYDSGVKEALMILKKPIKVDAIIAGNDVMACGVKDAAERLLGLNVPQDLAILGYDGIELAHWDSFDLSTITVEQQALSNAIIAQIEYFRTYIHSQEQNRPEPITVTSAFRKGKTT